MTSQRKRVRRTNAQVEAVREAAREELAAHHPMTLRQLHYGWSAATTSCTRIPSARTTPSPGGFATTGSTVPCPGHGSRIGSGALVVGQDRMTPPSFSPRSSPDTAETPGKTTRRTTTSKSGAKRMLSRVSSPMY